MEMQRAALVRRPVKVQMQKLGSSIFARTAKITKRMTPAPRA